MGDDDHALRLEYQKEVDRLRSEIAKNNLDREQLAKAVTDRTSAERSARERARSVTAFII